MNDAHRADAGAADGAGADRAHPQGRAGLMKYLSARAAMPAARGFCEILLEGLAPDGGLYLPERYPQVDAATLARWRGLPYRRARVRDPVALHRRHPGRRPARACAQDLHAPRCSARAQIVPLRAARATASVLEACRTGRRWPSRTWRCSCSATCSSTSWRAAASTLNILGATSGDTGSAAEYAMRGKRGIAVFMLSPHGRMSPFQQAQMFSLQDAEHPQHRRSKACSTTARTSSRRCRTTSSSSASTRIGTVNSINWARLLAQVVYYFAGYFQATRRRDDERGRASPCRPATSATSAPATWRA